METSMTPEQKPPPPPPESPLEVFRRMEGNRRLGEKMDVPRFLSDVQTLDQLKATEVPELLEHLRNLGKTRIIWGSLFNRLREGGQQNDWSSVIQDIHLAELLGMQELPEMADFLSQLKSKYEGPEPSPVKEPEQPEIPVYDKPWQEIFGRGASEISGNWSSSSHVFRPEKNPKVVVKVFDKHPQYFQLELWALQELQGLTGVVQLIGYNESQKPPYLVKKYIEGGDFYSRYLSSAPFFPANPQEAKQDKEFREDPNRDLEARKLYQQEFENAKIVAQWLISAMETLGEIHKRGIIVGDFKFADYPWDAENKRAILIDLTNAQPLDRRSPHYDKNSQVTPTKDIQSLLQVFFSQTNVGSESGFWIRDKMSTEWKNPKGGLLMYFTQEAIDLLRTGSQKTEASESLSQIINMAETLLEGDPFNPKPSAQEFAQALKDYFKEIGVYENRTARETMIISGVGFTEEANPAYRESMEDAHTVIENFGGKPNQSFFAIYDGHGGRETANYLAGNLHRILLRRIQAREPLDPKLALRGTYLEIDKQIRQEGIKGGATAVTAFIQGDKLFVANAGDARAVLNREGNAIRLSYDHKASDPEEKARIEAKGGWVLEGYVKGKLAVSRALGDWDLEGLREVVTAEPLSTETSLTPKDRFLILACDGVWDVIGDQEAVDLLENEPDPQRASEILKNEALKRGSTDNISVMVIKFF